MTCELCEALNEKYRLVKETNLSFCIVNREPMKPGHVMILPKRHVPEIDLLSPEEAADILNLCVRMKEKIKKKYGEDPLILLNTGKHRSQEHLHFHIWPSQGMIRDLVSNYEKVPGRKKASEEELEKLKKALE
ncbi:MAG: HIT family protein [Candidatus Nanoarchaeia archaeon]